MLRYALACLVAGVLSLPADGLAQQAVPDSGQRLQPGDAIRLVIWREPDLSGDFPVDEHGVVVLPKLGPMQVTAVEPDTLRAQIVQEYGKYLRNPSIQVTVLRRFNVLGSVMKPGLYSVDATMTVADALAIAGGAAPDGRKDRVDIFRGGELIAQITPTRRIAESPIRSGDQLFVPERSWLSRNTPVVATMLGILASLAIAFRP